MSGALLRLPAVALTLRLLRRRAALLRRPARLRVGTGGAAAALAGGLLALPLAGPVAAAARSDALPRALLLALLLAPGQLQVELGVAVGGRGAPRLLVPLPRAGLVAAAPP